MNQVLIAGRLTRDAEMRYTTSGKAVTKLSVATNERRGGEAEVAEFHAVIAWETLAVSVSELKKGDPVTVHGRLQTRKWEKDGVTHRATEIVATSIQFLSAPAVEPAREPIDDTPIF